MIEWRKELSMKKRERINSDQTNISNKKISEFKIPEPPIKPKADERNSIKQ